MRIYSLYVQLWRYYKNYLYFFDSNVYQIAGEHVCNVLVKCVDQFLIYVLHIKLKRPGAKVCMSKPNANPNPCSA